MDSSELPVTEWWDPENGVYDIPGDWLGEVQPEGRVSYQDWRAASDLEWFAGWVVGVYSPPLRMRRQLPSGLGQPGWLGHRDLCPIQWGDPCDCALPPRTTPCVCRYVPARGALIPNGSRFRINPRCVHHGDPARTPTPPACTCPGLGPHPDCRRHNTTPNEDGPQPIHDHPHNPYDLDEDERC